MKLRSLLAFCVIALSLLFISRSVHAFLNNFDTATIQEEGSYKGMLGISSSDDFFTVFGKLNYPISRGLEVTGRIGFLDADVKKDDTGALLGIGGRYKAAFFADERYPDLVLYGTYDFGYTGKPLHSLAGGFLTSKGFGSPEEELSITPYGGLEIEVLGGSLNDDTDLNLHVPLGLEVFFTTQFAITFEAKLGGGSSFGGALTYKF